MSILFLRRQYNWIPFLFIFTLFSIFIIIIASFSYDTYMQNQKYECESKYYLSLERENLKLISINKKIKLINEDNQKQIQQLLIDIEKFQDNLEDIMGVKKVSFEKTLMGTSLSSIFNDSSFEIVDSSLKLYLKKVYYSIYNKKIFIKFIEIPQELDIDKYYNIAIQKDNKNKININIWYNPKLKQIKLNMGKIDSIFYI